MYIAVVDMLYPSHPSRGAWIEISALRIGARAFQGRTPRGVRGLKSQWPDGMPVVPLSHPSRGAWIEISS